MLVARYATVAGILAVALFASAPTAFGQEHPLGAAPARQEDASEPECAKLNTEDAMPVGPGEFELEFVYSFSRASRQWSDHWRGENRGLAREHDFELGLTYGVVENLDIGVGLGYADMYDRDDPAGYGRGLMDVGIGAKWRFYHNEALDLSLAYLPGITIPFGRRSGSDHIGPSQEFWSIDQKLAMSKFWDRWNLNADVGYSLPLGEDADGARGTLDSNVALGYQLYDWLQPEVELNYAHDFVTGDSDSDQVALTAGLIMPISDTWRVDVGLQHSLAGRNSDRGTTAILAITHSW